MKHKPAMPSFWGRVQLYLGLALLLGHMVLGRTCPPLPTPLMDKQAGRMKTAFLRRALSGSLTMSFPLYRVKSMSLGVEGAGDGDRRLVAGGLGVEGLVEE